MKKMKKNIFVPIICSIFLGFIFGKIIFNKYDETAINAFKEKEKVYFLELNNVYDGSLKEDSSFIKEEDESSYHIYVGVTKNIKIANKIKELYEKDGNNISVIDKNVNSEEFLTILSEYDKIALIANRDDDLIEIEKIIMANYKEMVIK